MKHEVPLSIRGRVCKLEQLIIGTLEEQLEVVQSHGIAILEADQQPLLDDTKLLSAVVEPVAQSVQFEATTQMLVDEVEILLPRAATKAAR